MQIVIMVVATVLLLSGLIVVHEFGHYLVAKKRGIKVVEFAIGFGPRLIKWYRGETEFSIRPILFGGFVKFPDDVEEEPQEGDFRSASLKSKALTIVAGPAMNVILAIVLAIVFLTAMGEAQAVIADVQQGSPAQEAGLMEGDAIREMNGQNIDFFYYDTIDSQNAEGRESMTITVERDGERIELEVPYAEINGKKAVGISYGPELRPFSVGESFGLSFKWIGIKTGEILNALGGVFFRGEVENVGGIVATTVVVGQAVQSGLATVIMLASLISINLAIVNLLPIPALDGGKLVLYAIEGIRRKPASERLEGVLNLAGFVLLIGLSVFLVFQDVGRLVAG
ncbi:M50 family metallopeptidase [Christensenellaceae bacterium OttesenSCG-928-K19]|nr:M50 family metallopeptidase [Christensenellaceae bacterium OttesenSCG-928-K19]